MKKSYFLFFLFFLFNFLLNMGLYKPVTAAERDEVTELSKCLDQCLLKIPKLRKLFEINIKLLHDEILLEIRKMKKFNTNKKSSIGEKHLTLQILEENKNALELLDITERLTNAYRAIYFECNKENPDNNPLLGKDNEFSRFERDYFAWRKFVNGDRPFSINSILKSQEYKYEVQQAIAKGLSVSMDEVDYDPENLQYFLRVDKNGNILPSTSKLRKIKKKLEIAKAAGRKLTWKEQGQLELAEKKAEVVLKGTIMIYSPAPSDMSNPQFCKSVMRGTDEEYYCKNSIATKLEPIAQTAEKFKESGKTTVFLPIEIAPEISFESKQDKILVNRRQLNNIYSLISMQICSNRSELTYKTNTKTGRKEKLSKEGQKAEKIPIFRYRRLCSPWQKPNLPIQK